MARRPPRRPPAAAAAAASRSVKPSPPQPAATKRKNAWATPAAVPVVSAAPVRAPVMPVRPRLNPAWLATAAAAVVRPPSPTPSAPASSAPAAAASDEDEDEVTWVAGVVRRGRGVPPAAAPVNKDAAQNAASDSDTPASLMHASEDEEAATTAHVSEAEADAQSCSDSASTAGSDEADAADAAAASSASSHGDASDAPEDAMARMDRLMAAQFDLDETVAMWTPAAAAHDDADGDSDASSDDSDASDDAAMADAAVDAAGPRVITFDAKTAAPSGALLSAAARRKFMSSHVADVLAADGDAADDPLARQRRRAQRWDQSLMGMEAGVHRRGRAAHGTDGDASDSDNETENRALDAEMHALLHDPRALERLTDAARAANLADAGTVNPHLRIRAYRGPGAGRSARKLTRAERDAARTRIGDAVAAAAGGNAATADAGGAGGAAAPILLTDKTGAGAQLSANRMKLARARAAVEAAAPGASDRARGRMPFPLRAALAKKEKTRAHARWEAAAADSSRGLGASKAARKIILGKYDAKKAEKERRAVREARQGLDGGVEARGKGARQRGLVGARLRGGVLHLDGAALKRMGVDASTSGRRG
ncbi:hypothetical protein CXG81DRAFT_26152 [Caulochytrium protostelioides]|uniref:Uncharacterized protein n=1 Tax=Caulochytrium protostelioides TaxID=1555241 RepID=A0A4P9X7G6_9FUNG|nr:hypothetical protein CXG81DRAFT_26152 [Caulochytrium protostelioides]|eukprot:RKP01184.1 hypothetical protein CXG81DRAFT_26152 [Caulochytrium protostelioides]